MRIQYLSVVSVAFLPRFIVVGSLSLLLLFFQAPGEVEQTILISAAASPVGWEIQSSY
jgi:hypothetical protein